MAEQVTAPVLVGWSRVARWPGEPLDAWARALLETGIDPTSIDTLDVVYCQSWPYDDPPRRLADSVGADPRQGRYSGIGGTTPLSLIGEAGMRIARGHADVCAIVGGEQLATVRRLRKEGGRPDWSHPDPVRRPFPFEAPPHPSEVAHQVFQAYTTFALRDVARRARLGAPVEGYREGLGRLFAPMTEVAAADPHAWFPTVRPARELTTVTPANRMVAYPYTKLLTAIMDVDQASAVVIASEAAADRMGIPSDRRVFLRSWAEGRDPDHVAEHPDLSRSPAMERTLGQALLQAGSTVDDVCHFDIYSCFPASVSFSLDALGLAPDDRRAPFTVTGGLPYAGGPGSCYALGSVAAMADVLVRDPGALGMVTGVGMHLSKHAAVTLSTAPGPIGLSMAAAPAGAGDRCPIVDSVEGRARVAAYTVHHGADGRPTDALLVCDVGPARCYARADDPGLLTALEEEEHVGRTVTLTAGKGGNRASW